ncbi:transmembrane protein 39A isoform X1 [Schistocerca piceifrons]|uniref:transmembrane protein 39A isoform X1 n=1 Tax=Schistocerca piceifrons TaxID=274613 RepID=UPI001F5FE52C|nr:transmembrane protein 39A isoform X1 [Schistocerca piceifrons]
MSSRNKGSRVERETSSSCVFFTFVLCIAVLWSLRRWWNNTPHFHSTAVSRRRKFTRDPADGRRPPPLPVAIRDRLQKGGKSDYFLVMPGSRRNVTRPSSGRPPALPLGLPSCDDVQKSRDVDSDSESGKKETKVRSHHNLYRGAIGSIRLYLIEQPLHFCMDGLSFRARQNGSPGQYGENTSSRLIVPKHIPVPSIPQDGSMIFEMLMFIFTVVSSFLQFLHLYRTVWWLPQSHTKYTMNFYLIDPYLVGFIVTILGRRLVYCALTHFVITWCPAQLWPLVQQLLRLILLCLVMSSLVWSAYHILQNHPIVNIFYLCYPISVYFILFGLSISPFFDVTSLSAVSKEECKGRPIVGKPMHSCSMSPYIIRDEIEALKTDFNNRMKQVLFSSVLNAYYAGFVPCCFAQSFLYYDVYWATQHLAFVWLGCFMMYIVHCYPVRYCDILHRAALHLGCWSRIEGRSTHVPTHVWAESTVWHHGALVKHCKEIYRADGISNAAEPGNQTHARFYAIFNNPSVLLCILLGLQLLLIAIQLMVLIRCSEWYQVMSLALLLFANYYSLFKLARDYFVCWKVYKAEQMIQDKLGS